MSGVESVNAWKNVSSGTKVAVFIALAMAATAVVWLHFFS